MILKCKRNYYQLAKEFGKDGKPQRYQTNTKDYSTLSFHAENMKHKIETVRAELGEETDMFKNKRSS